MAQKDVTFSGGNALSGNNNGGDLLLTGGTGFGTGVSGKVKINSMAFPSSAGTNRQPLLTDGTNFFFSTLTQSDITGVLTTAAVPVFSGGDVSSTGGSLILTLSNVGTAGTYNSVTTDSKGRVISGTNSATTLSGDVTGPTTATVLATVNSNTGSFGDATHVGGFTVNSKGLITTASSTAITFPVTSVSGRTGAVTLTSSDVGLSSVTNDAQVKLSTITTAGDLLIGTGSATVSRLGIGSNTFVLTSNGTTASWAATVNSITGTTNQVIASSSTGAITLSLPQSINTAATPTFGSLSLGSGNLAFITTGQKITGDLSNATLLNRTLVQSSTLNGNTDFGIIPNGSAVVSSITTYNNADPTNAGITFIRTGTGESQLVAGITGTGSYLPLGIYTGGSERIIIDTSGTVLFQGAITEASPTVTFSATQTVNCSLGTVARITLTANMTSLTFSNVPASGSAYSITLMLTQSGGSWTVTWPASVKWSGGTAPTLSASGKLDIISLITVDGGTTWYAQASLNF